MKPISIGYWKSSRCRKVHYEMTVARGERDPYLDQIKTILTQALRHRKCQVYLFGSRATGQHRASSDFDVAVLASERISEELSLAREMLEQSNIPLKVDLIELSTAPRELVGQAEKEGILLWSN